MLLTHNNQRDGLPLDVVLQITIQAAALTLQNQFLTNKGVLTEVNLPISDFDATFPCSVGFTRPQFAHLAAKLPSAFQQPDTALK